MLMITVQFQLWDDALVRNAAQRENSRIEKNPEVNFVHGMLSVVNKRQRTRM